MTITAVSPAEIRWRASSDQVGHAFLDHGRALRTVCGLWGWSEQFDWPFREQCAECLLLFAAATEPAPGEFFEMWGR